MARLILSLSRGLVARAIFPRFKPKGTDKEHYSHYCLFCGLPPAELLEIFLQPTSRSCSFERKYYGEAAEFPNWRAHGAPWVEDILNITIDIDAVEVGVFVYKIVNLLLSPRYLVMQS